MGSWIHDGFLDSRWGPGFAMASWIRQGVLDLRRVLGFTMGSWIHDGYLDSRWVPGCTMGSCIHDGFLDSRWVPGFTMGSWIQVENENQLSAQHVHMVTHCFHRRHLCLVSSAQHSKLQGKNMRGA